ncbi:MAG: M20/M25/M40 family metallo-hydrolase, partial [Desulfobacterales bacterium]|nr:M20/M25/M40 family metallo-hydrolase [Desulfobacterales bacterium]
LGFGFILLLSIIVIRTLTISSESIDIVPVDISLDNNRISKHLSQAIQFKTISGEFIEFRNYLEKTFPQIHKNLDREIINEYSLIYKWKGKDEKLKPIVLMAHMDVVPIEGGTESKWTYPPFSGQISDGYIWGRGALDDKCSVIGILEAVETLIEQGFQPKQSVYLCFGHDEETGGKKGASKIAELFKSRGITFEYVIDEGNSIIDGVISFVSKPIALIGVTEKGYLTVELKVEGEGGGHSSMPPNQTSIGILSTAIHKLENNQMKPKLIEPVRNMLYSFINESPFLMRILFANQWLFSKIIAKEFIKSNTSAANVRTTTAVTMFNAGIKENVLPTSAKAFVNFRILPGDTINSVIKHVTQVINDARVKIKALDGAFEPTSVCDTNSPNFLNIKKTVKQIFPDVIAAPALVIVATDSRYFMDLSKDVYEFLPIWLKKEDFPRLHGTNERISIDNYEKIVRFYIQLIKNSNV